MLGKGLESLIPPQSNGGTSDNNGQRQDDAVPTEQDQQEQHEHFAPFTEASPAPQILHFEFADQANSTTPATVKSDTEEIAQRVSPEKEKQAPSNEKTPRLAAASPAEIGAKAGDYIFHIEVSKIRPNPDQPRRNFDEAGLRELAKSVREFGFLQPLVVTRDKIETPHGIDVEYELVAGERRLMAAKILGLEYVPAIVREVNLEREKLELAIIENLQREDLNPVEKARAFQRLQEEFRMTQREISSKLGRSRETVANTVRLLDLPAYLQEALEKGRITESHGRFLLQIADPAAQKKLFDDIVSHGLTTRDVKHRVQTAKPKKENAGETLPPELRAFEEQLTTELGAPVRIEKGGDTGPSTALGAGKIVITFYSEEELESIVHKIGGGQGERY